jgi:transcriptional regulator NrdR family protein
MRCSECGAPTQVRRSRTSGGGHQVVRQRECSADGRHRFETVEQRKQPGLGGVGVRRTGDEQLAQGGFDWDRFVRDVRNSVLKSLDEGETLAVCTATVRSIEERLVGLLQMLPGTESRDRPELRGWIWDRDVSDALEWQLRTGRARVAHVLYALTIHGRADRPGRSGWSYAADFLEWLFAEHNYPDLREPLTEAEGTPVDRWFPSSAPPNPRSVAKRNARVRPFRHPQFVASIRKAMVGRHNADFTSTLIADWVLWGMRGQPEVHSAQLAIGVLDCLRRVDDIAYLRWAAVAKRMSTVTQVRDEAIGLVREPSSRLVFDPSLRPRRPDPRPGLIRD